MSTVTPATISFEQRLAETTSLSATPSSPLLKPAATPAAHAAVLAATRDGLWSQDDPQCVFADTWDARHTLEGLRARVRGFAAARDWLQFHQPRNLALALLGEVGELCEILQWSSGAAAARGLPGLAPAKRLHFSEELADVTIYLTSLCERSGVDLAEATHAALDSDAAATAAIGSLRDAASAAVRALRDSDVAATPTKYGTFDSPLAAPRARSYDEGGECPATAELPAPREAASPASPRAAPTTPFDALRAAAEASADDGGAPPRSLCLAVAARAGALAGIFSAKHDGDGDRPGLPGWRASETRALGAAAGELLGALVRLARASGVDLGAACARKVAMNDAKYPAERVRGSSKKYNEYAARPLVTPPTADERRAAASARAAVEAAAAAARAEGARQTRRVGAAALLAGAALGAAGFALARRRA